MKRAMGCLLLAVLLACLTPVAGLANARMPQRRGALTDDADVLGAQVAADVAEYARRLEDETGIGLHVVLVHFLDGLDARSYANDLFSAWALGEDDLLLLGAAGEDSFAVALGDDVAGKLGRTNAENLLYTSSHFSALFKSQQYDAAMAAFAEALSSLVSRRNRSAKTFSPNRPATHPSGEHPQQLLRPFLRARLAGPLCPKRISTIRSSTSQPPTLMPPRSSRWVCCRAW